MTISTPRPRVKDFKAHRQRVNGYDARAGAPRNLACDLADDAEPEDRDRMPEFNLRAAHRLERRCRKMRERRILEGKFAGDGNGEILRHDRMGRVLGVPRPHACDAHPSFQPAHAFAAFGDYSGVSVAEAGRGSVGLGILAHALYAAKFGAGADKRGFHFDEDGSRFEGRRFFLTHFDAPRAVPGDDFSFRHRRASISPAVPAPSNQMISAAVTLSKVRDVRISKRDPVEPVASRPVSPVPSGVHSGRSRMNILPSPAGGRSAAKRRPCH